MTTTARHADPVPGPRGSWPLGMSRELRTDQLGTFERTMLAHPYVGRIVAGVPGHRVALYLVSHPDGVQHVLASAAQSHPKDTPFYEEIAAYLGDGLLTSEGERWRRQRRTLAPLFTPRRTAAYVPAMAQESARLVDRWTACAAPATVDLHAELTEFTLRVVARILFGTSVDDAIPAIRTMFPVLSEHVRRRGLTPFRLPRHWPTRGQRRAEGAQRALYRVVDDIVTARRGAPIGDDLLSLLLTAQDPETGESLTDRDVRDQVLIFLLAGHETTSTALTFACHLLGHHPQVQQRVRDEVDEVLGDRPPDAADVARLPYTGMVIREAMRLYPPAYAFGRGTATEEVIGGFRIPAGSVVLVSPWATHRHPDFWTEPQLFDPERFAPAAVAARHRYAYFPFSGGPRNCIGNHFALTEAVIALAVILRAGTLVTPPGPVPLTTGITLGPAGAVPCRVERRAAGR
jgi:cytochrome P450